MADKKISELDAIAGSATASDDLFLIVDSSGSVTKKISREELNNAIEQDVLSTVDINGGTIDSTVIGGTTPAAGDFTTLGATGNITVGGTVDGRDVATDGTKLDGIAASATANPNAIDNVVDDVTPQLGGNLDLNNFNITGTGDIPAANLTGALPAIDGSALTGIATDLVDDVTPQLGGNLDLNNFNITGTGGIPSANLTGALPAIDGSALTGIASGEASLILYEYTATSGQTTFSGSDDNAATLSYTANNIQVVMNGVILDPSDYTATNGTSVVLAAGATTGDLVNIYAFESFTVADTVSASAGGTFNANVTVVGTLAATALTGDGSALTGVASDVVDDTTPQLGGDLDLNSNGITGTGDIDITGKVIASTNVGVGTSSPAVAIHATKTTGTSQRVRMENSEGSADFGTDANKALIWVGGNQRFTLESGGKLLLNAEGGSVATVDVRQGSAKHWVHFTGTGTPSVQDSHNHTSITDRGTGDYSVNLNNNMNNANYISSGHCGWDGTGWAGNLFHYEAGMNTGAYRIVTARPDSLSKRDMLSVMPMAHGDLA